MMGAVIPIQLESPAADRPHPVAARARPLPAREVQCGLCGHRFLPTADTMSCASCPFQRRCAVICCPHCGYEFVTESRVVDFFRRLFRR
jgi:hypothetical protein